MSGPKTSKYTLILEQRRILARQREMEWRKAVATENIKKSQKRLLQIGGMFGDEKQIAAELTARTGSDNGLSILIDELGALITSINPLVAHTNFDDVSSLEETSNTASTCLKDAEKIVSKIRSISSMNETSLKNDFQEAIDVGFSTSFVDINEIEESAASHLRTDASQRLSKLQTLDFLPHTYKSEICEVVSKLEKITNDVFLKNYIAISVNPLIKQVNQYITEYRECKDEFEKLYTEYLALCKLYYYVAQEYVCSRSSIQALRSEIARIKKAIVEDDEQAYISDCLDEVMSEMGYSVLGTREVTKRNGKRFRNELYSYGEGTAVNITYSSDGKIAMELGGIDTSDRTPTVQETEKLCDSMQQFCVDFKEIEKRLLSKGVMLTERVSLLPPDAEYAQIINITDYAMETEAESLNVKKQVRSITKPKALRRE